MNIGWSVNDFLYFSCYRIVRLGIIDRLRVSSVISKSTNLIKTKYQDDGLEGFRRNDPVTH